MAVIVSRAIRQTEDGDSRYCMANENWEFPDAKHLSS